MPSANPNPDLKKVKLPKDTPIGVIAGGGDLPKLIIDDCVLSERPVFVAALKDMANPKALKHCDHAFFPMGAVGKIIQNFKKRGIEHMMFTGSVKRPSLIALKPDLKGAKLLAQLVTHPHAGDNTLLSTLIQFFEKEGFTVIGADHVVPDLLMPQGCLTATKPNKEAEVNIDLGHQILSQIGDLDIGQSIAVQQNTILGVEAIEGTDALIARTGELRLSGEDPILVKIKKPNQDPRVDLPTIGPITIDNLVQAGFQGIAVKAGEALLLHRDEVIDRANKQKIFVVGI